MSQREELIKQCRYYKGEEENPFEGNENSQNAKMFWEYERGWVFSTLRGDTFEIIIDDYKWHGLDGFRADDGIPMSLKALLFNRYVHWCGGYGNDREGFINFFNSNYLT